MPQVLLLPRRRQLSLLPGRRQLRDRVIRSWPALIYDLCLEPRAIQEAGAAGFDVSIALLRVTAASYGSEVTRKESSFPKEFRRAGATDKEKAPAVAVLHEIKFGEGLSKQDAERQLSELAAKLKQGDGYADSLVEEMGYAEKIERTKPVYVYA